jgi:hypothetical protein
MSLHFLTKNSVIIFLLVLCSFIFFAYNVSGQGYTLDEPQTVGVARTVLQFGYPSPWDGKSIFASMTSEYTKIQGRYFWTWHPWLQFYLIAPMLAVFGNSVGMIRLPFVFFGALTVGMLYFVSLELFKNKAVSLLLSLQLLFLLPFFLYVRQAHYYSPAAFFSLVLLWLYLRCIKTSLNKKLFCWMFFIGVLLFETNYLVWLSDMAILFVLACWRRQAGVFAILVLSGLFGFLWFKSLDPYSGNPLSAYLGHANLLRTIFLNLSYLNNFVLPLVIGIVCVFAAIKLSQARTLLLLLFVIGVKVLIYSIIVDPHGRFLVDCMPLCLLLYGFLYCYLLRIRKSVLVVLLFVLITTTNILSLIPVYMLNLHERQVRWYPMEFASEFTYDTQYEYVQIGQYLSAHARPGDVFWTGMYTWSTELYTNVPMLDAVCDTSIGRLIGPYPFKDPSKVRWYIFTTTTSDSLINAPCLGEKWEKYLVRNYSKKEIRLNPNTYQLNDTDIVNRSFPPLPQPDTRIVIYEKKS